MQLVSKMVATTRRGRKWRSLERSGRPEHGQLGWMATLAMLCFVVGQVSLAQQQQISRGSAATTSHADANSMLLSEPQQVPLPPTTTKANSQKIGLAPHDRPACQLPPIVAQRRHLTASQLQPPPQHQQQQLQFSGAIDRELMASGGESDLTGSSNPDLANQSGGFQSSLLGGKIKELGAKQQQQSTSSVSTTGSAKKPFDSSERLRQLRQLLASNNYDAYLVTPDDEHGSEYVADYDRRVRFISGFTGSHGYALVLLDRAVFFTDGRYAIQADRELDCNWWLVVGASPLEDIPLWLKANAAKGLKIATDARLMPLRNFDYLDEHIRKLDSEFALISQDLVDVVWNNAALDPQDPTGARSAPQGPIFVHPVQFAGNVSWQEKVIRVAESMAKLKARHYVVSQLDDIAWLLNLRGTDIPMSPLFKAYLFISRSNGGSVEQQATAPASSTPSRLALSQSATVASVEQLLSSSSAAVSHSLQAPQVLQVQPSQTIRVTLYADLKRIDQSVREHLHVNNGTLVVQAPSSASLDSSPASSTRIQIELKDYDVFLMDIRDKLAPAGGARQLQGKLLLNAADNVAIHMLANFYDDRLVLMESLVSRLKAVKSDSEVQGMRLAHWRDSLAISMLLAQLELDIGQKGLTQKWSETSAASELEFYRSLMDHNRGQSFGTISAYGPNAAVVHYAPGGGGGDHDEQRTAIGNRSTYLLDSGGQYLDGTTDITRTTHYGEPTEFQRETYTRVLMGAIDMMSLIFEQPARSAYRLNDLLARRHLFELGLDYEHGTGHGIGLYSLVHEKPFLIEQYTSGAQKSGQANDDQRRQQQQQTVGANQQQQQQLRPKPAVHNEPVLLQANMFTSVEPGYYKANDFGIRLENIVVTQRVHPASGLSRPNDRQETSKTTTERRFLRFEPISLVPFEPKLMKLELLSNKQKTWLNSYHMMVRLRMTQQINYYLAKIRNHQAQPPSVQVFGTASSSRLYQQLLARQTAAAAANSSSNNNKSEMTQQQQAQIQLGYYNFLRMDGAQLQEKLEQTHRWMMAKTELIPLDVPQALLNGGGGADSKCRPNQQNSDSGQQQHLAHSFRSGAQSQGWNERSPVATATGDADNLDVKRLMLAYMSSLPFNDEDAGAASLEGRADNSTAGLGIRGAKCAGLECDLWLVSALNSAQQRQQRLRHSQQSPGSGWTDAASGDLDLDGQLLSALSASSGSSSGSLMDLFQLDGAGQAMSVNVWSLLVLGALVALQLGVATYICRGRRSGTRTLAAAPSPSAAPAVDQQQQLAP